MDIKASRKARKAGSMAAMDDVLNIKDGRDQEQRLAYTGEEG